MRTLRSAESRTESLYGIQVVYSFAVGGSETLALRLANALDEPAARWGLVSARSKDGPISVEARKQGLTTAWLDLESVGAMVRLLRLLRLAKWLRQRRVEVAHVHHLVSLRDTYWALRLGGVRRIVLTEHTAEPLRRVRHLPLIWRFYDRLVDHLTVVSAEIAREVHDFVPRARIPVVIVNGVDTTYFVPRSDLGSGSRRYRTVGWLGRLHPDKDVCTGIRAFDAARSRLGAPDSLRMTIGGVGPEEGRAINLVQELGLSPMVEFLGSVEDVRSFLQRVDVLLISSITEGLPLVLLEAMSSAVPVVATDEGGIATALGGAGRLCPPGNVDAMAECLVEVLESPGLGEELGSQGRERVVERYSMDEMVQHYRDLYGD